MNPMAFFLNILLDSEIYLIFADIKWTLKNTDFRNPFVYNPLWDLFGSGPKEKECLVRVAKRTRNLPSIIY